MELEHVDLSIERRQYYSKKWALKECPECHQPIEEKHCPVYVIVEHNKDFQRFMTSLCGAHFCDKCPVVVFDCLELEKAVKIFMKMEDGLKYSVMGIVDLATIPKEKRHLEIGTEENPMPLVEFLPPLDVKPTIFTAKPSQNVPCPCGSGKKYKRCCGK